MRLSQLKNIGKEIERKLNTVGIHRAEDLKQVGSKEAFLKLKASYPNVCLVHLYTLEGAIKDVEYNQLSDKTKKELKKFKDELKK